MSVMHTAHIEHKGHCWEVQAEDIKKFDHFKAQAKHHGYDLKDGACKTKEIHHFKHMGVTISEHGAGASQPSPFMDLGDIIHVNVAHGGAEYCMQLSGKLIANQKVRDMID